MQCHKSSIKRLGGYLVFESQRGAYLIRALIRAGRLFDSCGCQSNINKDIKLKEGS